MTVPHLLFARPPRRGTTGPRARRPRRAAGGLGRAAALTAASLLTVGLLPGQASAEPSPTPAPSTAPAASAAPTAPAPAAIGPVDYAIAVDESGSLKPAEVDRERAAAAGIALGEVHPKSTVTVLGFASADNDAQHPVDEVCPPTVLDGAGRDRIGACIGNLRSRKPDEGQGTDFPNAILQGVSRLSTGTDPATPRVLFLLTDGKLDVGDSPAYGDDRDHRATAGEAALAQALAAAQAARIQVWPLGFGSDIDRAALDRMAAAGFQDGCVDLPDARPRATAVPDAAAVAGAMQTAFAAAHCLRATTGGTGHPPIDIEMRISPLTTVGSIVVDKGDPAVTATYFDPSGRQITATTTDPISKFELSPRDQTVESLRITDPAPGQWKVHLDAPADHRAQLASVSVLWRGALRSSITMAPPSPRPGEQAVVTLKLQTRKGVQVTDPQDLKDLKVSAVLSGDGFAPVPVRLADDGTGPDRTAGDATFSGTVTVPATATGRIKASGTLAASGLTADEDRTQGTLVAPAVPKVTAGLTLDDTAGHKLHPGDALAGRLDLHNADGTPHTLRLALRDTSPGLLAVSPEEVTLAPGESRRVDVAVRAARPAAFRGLLDGGDLRLGGKVTLVDGTDQDRVLVDSPLSLTVTRPPTFWESWWWALLLGGLVAVLAALVVLVLHRGKVTGRNPAGLKLLLLDQEGHQLADVTADSGTNGWYEFDVAGLGGPYPRLVRKPGGPYRVQRSRDGGAVLEKRRQSTTRIHPDRPASLTDGLGLGIRDERRAPRRRTGPTARPRPGRAESPSAPPAAPPPTTTYL
ncbi:vWA domain-containing protein [Kitasatospora sp. NPDC036755]|uniref:vWA domain-containing protein n=1 Tax=Kitasatospora sp. NPDC036755 TaxID=3154600 RepID=UPI0033F5B908